MQLKQHSVHDLRGLYVITDGNLTSDKQLLAYVRTLLDNNVSLIQYRDKSKDKDKRFHQASELLQLCQEYKKPLIINDDIELAKQINAGGVHIGQADGSITKARDLLGAESIIGVSCYGSLEFAFAAQKQNADYVSFGACFASPTKPQAPIISLATVKNACAHLTIPVVAIGGITLDNAASVLATGVSMLAIISDLAASDSLADRIKKYNQLF